MQNPREQRRHAEQYRAQKHYPRQRNNKFFLLEIKSRGDEFDKKRGKNGQDAANYNKQNQETVKNIASQLPALLLAFFQST